LSERRGLNRHDGNELEQEQAEREEAGGGYSSASATQRPPERSNGRVEHW
jgi:hypothetical protein